MTAHIISGKDIAQDLIQSRLKPRVEALKAQNIIPRLVVFFVGEDPASASYIRQKEKSAVQAGIESEVRKFSVDISESAFLKEIEIINQDDSIHGVIVQVPLPKHIDPEKVINAIDPSKDVDGFCATSVGKLFLGQETFQSCTPKGIIELIKASGTEIKGSHAVVIGRSNNVGKPVALLLLQENATVTICHRHTKNLSEQIQQADILVVAVGQPKFVQGASLKPGCTVIDVGIHRQEDGKLCGDVDFETAKEVAAKITPVPGGVGPMTVVSLIENTIQSAEMGTA